MDDMDDGEAEAREIRPIAQVMVFPNGMCAVFDAEGQQISFYQGYWREKRVSILKYYDGVVQHFITAERCRELGL